jgi:hypothetical protein
MPRYPDLCCSEQLEGVLDGDRLVSGGGAGVLWWLAGEDFVHGGAAAAG